MRCWILVVITLYQIWCVYGRTYRIKHSKQFSLPKCDDCNKFVTLPENLTFDNTSYRYATVSTNGYIVLWRNTSTSVALPSLPPDIDLPVPFVAPFWANITTMVKDNGKTVAQGHLMVQVMTGPKSTLARALTIDINHKFKTNYTSKILLLAAWLRVTHSGGSKETKKNTFQVILTTDGTRTFVIFKYGDINWSRARNTDAHAMAVIDFGDNKTKILLPGSLNDSIVDIGTKSNVAQRPGSYVYKVSPRDTTAVLGDQLIKQQPAKKSPKKGRPAKKRRRRKKRRRGKKPRRKKKLRRGKKRPSGPRTSKDKETLRLVLNRAPSLGGFPVTVSGLDFKKQVQCRFDKIIVTGKVIDSGNRAVCITPMFARVGIIPLSVSVDSGRTFTPAVDFDLVAPGEGTSVQLTGIASSWGDLVAVPGVIRWPESFFKNIRNVSVIYAMLIQSKDPNKEPEFKTIVLKKNVNNTGSLSFADVDLSSQKTLQPEFIGAICIQSADKTKSLWSAVHPASWYYDMFVKESINRNWTVKPEYIVAAEAALGGPITKKQISTARLVERISGKAAQINNKFFKTLCEGWAKKDKTQAMAMEHLPGCPCKLIMAKSDGRFVTDTTASLSNKNDTICMRSAVPSAEGGEQQCCYGHTGELLPSTAGGGSVSRFSATRQPNLYMLHDYWPKIMCDKLTNDTTAYRQLRPTDVCTGYMPPKLGAAFGLGHVAAFSGTSYRFCGVGRFWIVRGSDFSMQAETSQVKTMIGHATNDIVWNAVVMKTGYSDTIEVRPSRDVMDIYVNGKQKEPNKTITYFHRGVDVVCEPNNQTVTLRFNAGKGCVVQVRRIGLSLAFSVRLLPIMKLSNVALYKEAFVSISTLIAEASKAVDGILNTDTRMHSCTIVKRIFGNPWWQVDLTVQYIVRSVTITACSDKWGNRLRNIIIDVLQTFSPTPAIRPTNTTCALAKNDKPFALGETRHVPCSSDQIFKGRFIRITQLGSDLDMILCEVQVDGTREHFVNVAAGKPAYQSSTAGIASAAHSADGIVDTNSLQAHCSRTTQSSHSWWKVDLKSTYRVDNVAVVPCHQPALCSNKLSSSPKREPQLEVNVARGKPAKQSSSTNLYMCEASNAVDGMTTSDIKKNSCSLTKSQLGAWWEVDLGAVYEINAVVITSPNSVNEDTDLVINLALGRPTKMSSTYYGSVSGKAVDGKRKPNLWNTKPATHTCMSTSGGKGNWWQVDLEAVYAVREVVIYNRILWHYNKGLVIQVLMKTQVSICYVIDILGPGENKFPCRSGAIGSVVKITREGYIVLCEVEVYGTIVTTTTTLNLALRKPTKMSTTLDDYYSSRAVDGNKESVFGKGNSCSETHDEMRAWWQVDLQAVYLIKDVVITNRATVGQRLHDIVIEGLMQTEVSICEVIGPALKNGETRRIPCRPETVGRFVRIRQNGTRATYLTLCEVEVHGTFVKTDLTSNLAVGKPTTMSTVHGTHYSSEAVDGTRDSVWKNNTCSHTSGDPLPWWHVDLQAVYLIREVIITNRDIANDPWTRDLVIEAVMQTQVSLCGILTPYMKPSEIRRIPCQSETFGRFVKITKKSSSHHVLVLCEVEVYGTQVKTDVSGNLAFGKPTKMSSVEGNDYAWKAVDGRRDSNHDVEDCCYQSIRHDGNWWQVDLQAVYMIKEVTVTNRGNAYYDRLHDFVVQVLMGNSVSTCGSVGKRSLKKDETRLFQCQPKPAIGSIVKIQMDAYFLVLCEVEVYGVYEEGLHDISVTALQKSIARSTTCQTIGQAFGSSETRRINCGADVKGSVVRIRSLGNVPRALSLCEVQVYGTYVTEDTEVINLALGKPTKMSSTARYASKNAVDGNRNSVLAQDSCTNTNQQVAAWWEVDMQNVYLIKEVIITNRADGMGNLLRNIAIQVWKQKQISRCANIDHIPLKDGETRRFPCVPGTVGNVVHIRRISTESQNLSLCEVEVYGTHVNEETYGINLAHAKPTRMSSVLSPFGPSKAVDGDRTSIFQKNSCAHTLNEKGAWWQVDLQAVYFIREVVITNRGDCCGDWLHDIVVEALKQTEVSTCEVIVYALKEGETKRIPCWPGTVGSIIKIRQNATTAVNLILCEVEVYGTQEMPEKGFRHNVALNKPATQSYITYDAAASRAVDGNHSPLWSGMSCMYASGVRPWWMVDLQGVYLILDVVLTNRVDYKPERLHQFSIKALVKKQETICANVPGALGAGETRRIPCPADVYGHNIKIQIGGNAKEVLLLCEVEVHGYYVSELQTPAHNLAFGKPTKQSRILYSPHVSSRAVNPYRGSCAIAGSRDGHAWWQVEFEVVYIIWSVTITAEAITMDLANNLALGKPTQMSSLYYHDVSSRAVDGNRNSLRTAKSCTHTNSEKGAWWQVELQAVYLVKEVIITNRAESMGKRLHDIVIEVLSQSTASTCAVIGPALGDGETRRISCRSGQVGSVVRIRQNYTNPEVLTLCEVEVYGTYVNTDLTTNLALRKPTSMSSTQYGGVSSRAVDGNKHPVMGHKSCTHTEDNKKNAWWRVDLKVVYLIREVVITNRADNWGKRLHDFVIEAHNENNVTICEAIGPSLKDGETRRIPCRPGAIGSVIKIRHNLTTPEVLSLCEVEVYGTDVVKDLMHNLALGMPTKMSSTYEHIESSRAVDGNRNRIFINKSCTHTKSENRAWWQVNLHGVHVIREVVITNRADNWGKRLHHVAIQAMLINKASTCAKIYDALQDGETRLILCQPGAVGNGIRILQFAPKTEVLTLCEVEVYGTPHVTTDATVNLAYKKPASMSSQLAEYSPSRGVDGLKSPVFNKKGCFHTNAENDPWWQVDLQAVYLIKKVILTNRADNNGYRFHNVVIEALVGTTVSICEFIGAAMKDGEIRLIPCLHGAFGSILRLRKYDTTVGPMHLCEVEVYGIDAVGLRDIVIEALESQSVIHSCASVNSAWREETKHITCKQGTKGRALKIKTKADTPLHICEVQVFGAYAYGTSNLALGKTTLQLNTPYATHHSANAVDGKRNKHCAICVGVLVWWEVDLERFYRIREVSVTNRKDCCADRLKNFLIEAYTPNAPRTCAIVGPALGLGETKYIACHPDTKGSKVRIRLLERYPGQQLQLCEVEVFAVREDMLNLARAKPTKQAVTPWKDRVSSTAVNGKRGTEFYAVTFDWWMVNLEAYYLIWEVVITQGHDCCQLRDFVIEAFHPSAPRMCAHIIELIVALGGTQHIPCRPDTMGSKIRIRSLTNEMIILTEVQVFGESATYQPNERANLALKKRAWLLSTTKLKRADNTVDGNTTAVLAAGSCSTTGPIVGSSWLVDLEAVYDINHVIIFNRADCCGEELHDFRITAELRAKGPPGFLCAEVMYALNTSEIKSFTCRPGTMGSIVKIQLTGDSKRTLTLCEVEVYGDVPEIYGHNLALWKPTKQSSTSNPKYASLNAVDGIISPIIGQVPCAQTSAAAGSWWQVDLEAMYEILELMITAYRKEDINLAFGMPANMSSTYYRSWAWKAVDGRREPNLWGTDSSKHTCSSTIGEVGPWWQVDLGSVYDIKEVVIYNRKIWQYNSQLAIEVLMNSKVSVCEVMNYTLLPNENRFPCRPGAIGSVVRIKRTAPRKKYMALCEVEVYGTPVYVTPSEYTSFSNLDDFVIEALVPHSSMRITCAYVDRAFRSGETRRIMCGPGVIGSIVRISRIGTIPQSLMLCEVNVYGAYAGVVSGVTVDVSQPETFSRMPCGISREYFVPGTMNNIKCASGSEGRFVTITANDKDQILSLNEVQVYGEEVLASNMNLAFLYAVEMSTTDGIHDGSLSVDGNKDPRGLCASTLWQVKPFWRLQLGNLYTIHSVIIFTPECCTHSFPGMNIQIYDILAEDPHLCATALERDWKLGQKNVFRCLPGTIGRHVWISSNEVKPFPIHFCEVQVTGESVKRHLENNVNLAVGKPTLTSSTANNFHASRAVDGRRDSAFNMNSCSATQAKKGSWWQVDLKAVYLITEVVITNRADCCGDWLHDVTIEARKDSTVKTCNVIGAALLAGETRRIPCRPETIGQFVKLKKDPNDVVMLVLCEVEVYGTSVTTGVTDNLAFMKPSKMSSIHQPGISSRAVDGNKNSKYSAQSCTHTNAEKGAWWQVELQAVYLIREVIITNRADNWGKRLHHIVIEALNHQKASICEVIVAALNDGETRRIPCQPGAVGSVVRIRQNYTQTEFLSLCEVEVYGIPAASQDEWSPKFRNVAVNKNAMQSSTEGNMIASAALDSTNNCSETKMSESPWWQVDLGVEYIVQQVTIRSRTKCCDRMYNDTFIIEVGMGVNDVHPMTCALTAMREKMHQKCPVGTRGNVVKFTLPGPLRKLALCQVHIYGHPVNRTNLANGKRAVQSSTVAPASLATDGRIDTNERSCARTKYEKNPWLQVDLETVYEILHVVITTTRSAFKTGDDREDLVRGKRTSTSDKPIPVRNVMDSKRNSTKPSCGDAGSIRATWWQVELEAMHEIWEVVLTKMSKNKTATGSIGRHFVIELFDELVNHTCAVVKDDWASDMKLIPCMSGTKGSRVRISLREKEQFQICEVQVFGIQVQEARDNIVDVSASADGPSERCAVVRDGYLLNDTQRITCAAGLKGRFVKITVAGLNQSLSLCEVQVYGITGIPSGLLRLDGVPPSERKDPSHLANYMAKHNRVWQQRDSFFTRGMLRSPTHVTFRPNIEKRNETVLPSPCQENRDCMDDYMKMADTELAMASMHQAQDHATFERAKRQNVKTLRKTILARRRYRDTPAQKSRHILNAAPPANVPMKFVSPDLGILRR